jgi:hypothetical protein
MFGVDLPEGVFDVAAGFFAFCFGQGAVIRCRRPDLISWRWFSSLRTYPSLHASKVMLLDLHCGGLVFLS